jgi:hypothetical protein
MDFLGDWVFRRCCRRCSTFFGVSPVQTIHLQQCSVPLLMFDAQLRRNARRNFWRWCPGVQRLKINWKKECVSQMNLINSGNNVRATCRDLWREYTRWAIPPIGTWKILWSCHCINIHLSWPVSLVKLYIITLTFLSFSSTHLWRLKGHVCDTDVSLLKYNFRLHWAKIHTANPNTRPTQPSRKAGARNNISVFEFFFKIAKHWF